MSSAITDSSEVGYKVKCNSPDFRPQVFLSGVSFMVPPCWMIQFLELFISSLISSQCGLIWLTILSVQFSSVAQLCPTLCNPMDCSTPDFPVHHQLPEVAQTHVHWVSDAIQPSHPLSSPSPPPSIFPSIRVFSNESALRIRWPKYWSFSFNISPSND